MIIQKCRTLVVVAANFMFIGNEVTFLRSGRHSTPPTVRSAALVKSNPLFFSISGATALLTPSDIGSTVAQLSESSAFG